MSAMRGWGRSQRFPRRKRHLSWASEDGPSARRGRGDRVLLQAKGAACSEAQKPYESEWGVCWARPGAEPGSTHGENLTGLGSVSVTLDAAGDGKGF